MEVPFPTDASNLSFAIVTPSLMAAGTTLAVIGKDEKALLWTDDDYLGPFARRADRALIALESAGADPTAIDAIVAAWETALAERDPAQGE